MKYKAAVLTISDSCSGGMRDDKTGIEVQKILEGLPAEIVAYDVVPDDIDAIRTKLIYYCDTLDADFVFTNGGTGFSPQDVTPEATMGVIEREASGLSEYIRSFCSKENKRAILSRGVSGIRGSSMIINLPGSPSGASESLISIFSVLAHAVAMIKGDGH